MIEITKEEALTIVKVLSQIEGTLVNMRADNAIVELLDYPVDLLCEKILDVNNDE